MSQKMSRAERKTAYLKHAEQLFEEMENWYDAHPEASFEELEETARHSRRKLMGASLSIFVNGRDDGKQADKPLCRECGEAMTYKGEVSKTIYGLEGESRLERAYYHCPNRCEVGSFFPSG